MKASIKGILFAFIFLGVPINSFSNETVRVAAEEWAPFSSVNLKHNGLMCRIITEAFALENVQVEYGFFPGARALHLVKHGKWDAVGGWTPTEERGQYYYFSDMLLEETVVFFHLKKFPFNWKTWDDLAGLRIGATLDYYYGKGFEQADKDGKLLIERVYSDEQNLKKLLAGRIDLFAVNLDSGLTLIQDKFTAEETERVTYHKLPLDEGPLVLMFSKKDEKNKQRVNLFNRGLKKLRASGKYDLYFEESRQGKYRKAL